MGYGGSSRLSLLVAAPLPDRNSYNGYLTARLFPAIWPYQFLGEDQLKRISIHLALQALIWTPIAVHAEAPTATTAAPSAAQRQELILDDGWRFKFGEPDLSQSSPGFDDRGWKQISVPHSWNRIGEYALERSADTNNDQGIGWYRLTVSAPAAAPGMRQYLDFAAVGNIADVWVNGRHVGTHKGAFSRFRLDVTRAWKPGEANLVAVRADNSKPAEGSSTENVIPLAGDFFIHGGIYREAKLIQLPSASIDPLDYGGPGVYAQAAEINDDRAIVDVRTRLRNFDAEKAVSVKTTIRDGKGKVIAASVIPVSLANGWQDATQRLEIVNPRRWDGLEDPYLYSVTATLLDGDAVLDSVTQPLGLRTFRFDADDGFFLNGRHVKLHGVSRHQDRLGQGWALTREDHAEDMALIREMGANTVRQAHYQHADAWSDEADRAGMVVWAELPYVGAPSLTGGKGSPELWANAERQMRELVRQNFNHPSITMWSIGNEVDSAKAFGAMKENPSPIDLLKRMNEVAKEEDPSRATVFADFSEDLGFFGKIRQPMTGVADLVGYNRYPGWYFFQTPQAGLVLGGMLDSLHAKNPAVPVSVSEYGAGGAISQHSDDPVSGYVASAGRPQPEEYQAFVQELTWPAIASRDYVFASWVWNMFDFASDLRNEGDSVDINTKGLVTMDRKTRKDAFYYYKAAWSAEPMIHLTGKRYAERSYPVMDVKAYTNAPAASLFMNGDEIGEVNCPNSTCIWKGVRLVPGVNTAVVRATFSGNELSDSASFDGIAPLTDGIRIDAGNLAASQLGGLRYGSDTFVAGGKPVARYSGSIGGRSEGPDIPVEAERPALFDYWREGDRFDYSIPVPDGDWTLTLHMTAPGKRKMDPEMAAMLGEPVKEDKDVVMSVSANGKTVIDALNVEEAAGGTRKGIIRSFPVTVEDGTLQLTFTGTGGGKALVAAIEITK